VKQLDGNQDQDLEQELAEATEGEDQKEERNRIEKEYRVVAGGQTLAGG
jgi:hypothetical protein